VAMLWRFVCLGGHLCINYALINWLPTLRMVAMGFIGAFYVLLVPCRASSQEWAHFQNHVLTLHTVIARDNGLHGTPQS
jgi:hypothetical protein